MRVQSSKTILNPQSVIKNVMSFNLMKLGHVSFRMSELGKFGDVRLNVGDWVI